MNTIGNKTKKTVKIGDTIRVNLPFMESGIMIGRNRKAKVVKSNFIGWLGLEFKGKVKYCGTQVGHDCKGNGKFGHCWYISRVNMKYLSKVG